MYQVVIDTNVLVSALRSSRGASFRLLKILGDSRWRPNLTAGLALEYEAVLKRENQPFGMATADIDDLLDAFCAYSGLHHLYFQWRPVALDPDDDLVIEAAIASHSDFIVTFNKRDFTGSHRFGIECLNPKEFLILIGELS